MIYFAALFYARHWLIHFIRKKSHQFGPGEQLQVFFPEQPICVCWNQNRNAVHLPKTNVPWLEIALTQVPPSRHCNQGLTCATVSRKKINRMGKVTLTAPSSERHLLSDKKDKHGIDLCFNCKLRLINEQNYLECAKATNLGRKANRVRLCCLEHSYFLLQLPL